MTVHTKPTTNLVSDLVSETTGLMRTEMALARAEMSEKVDQAKIAIAGIIGGAIIMLAGLFILFQALVIALTNLGLSPGWAATAVGLIAFLVATAMILSGANALSPDNLKPSRTIRQMEKDKAAMEAAIQ